MEFALKDNYYLDIAEAVSKKSTCLRRQFGAVIVNNDEVLSTGFNGAPRGRTNCSDLPTGCVREKLHIPRGERYELCRSVHAEANAIISCSRDRMLNGTLYLVGKDVATGSYVPQTNPCSMCKRLILNAGISKVVCRENSESFVTIDTSSWISNDESLEGIFGY